MLARLQVISMTENRRDQSNGAASDTTAHLLRWITLAIAMAAFLLASSLFCELSLRTAAGLPAAVSSLDPN
jgi:hypothetical protein